MGAGLGGSLLLGTLSNPHKGHHEGKGEPSFYNATPPPPPPSLEQGTYRVLGFGSCDVSDACACNPSPEPN